MVGGSGDFLGFWGKWGRGPGGVVWLEPVAVWLLSRLWDGLLSRLLDVLLVPWPRPCINEMLKEGTCHDPKKKREGNCVLGQPGDSPVQSISKKTAPLKLDLVPTFFNRYLLFFLGPL